MLSLKEIIVLIVLIVEVCSETWYLHGIHEYYISNTTRFFSAANASCVMMGAELIMLKTGDIQQFLLEFFLENTNLTSTGRL